MDGSRILTSAVLDRVLGLLDARSLAAAEGASREWRAAVRAAHLWCRALERVAPHRLWEHASAAGGPQDDWKHPEEGGAGADDPCKQAYIDR
jgi:hypothetical protein